MAAAQRSVCSAWHQHPGKTAWKSSLIHLREFRDRQARDNALQQLFSEISDQQLKFVSVCEEQVTGRDWVAGEGAQIHCKASPIYKNAPRITTCSAEEWGGHSNSANHKRAAEERAGKLGKGEEKTSRTSPVINLFSKHTRTKIATEIPEVFWKHWNL